MNSPSYCLQKMLWQYTYEIYINTLIAIIYFLSKHHLQGGDREQHSKTIALVISIHTTRKVVTATCRDCGIVTPDFNPHHPQGGDEWHSGREVHVKDFNPHHPQGGDSSGGEIEMAGYISIHTTRKVVTIKRWWESLFQRISIHTIRKVVTRAIKKAATLMMISIHTTRKVVTRCRAGC